MIILESVTMQKDHQMAAHTCFSKLFHHLWWLSSRIPHCLLSIVLKFTIYNFNKYHYYATEKRQKHWRQLYNGPRSAFIYLNHIILLDIVLYHFFIKCQMFFFYKAITKAAVWYNLSRNQLRFSNVMRTNYNHLTISYLHHNKEGVTVYV